MAITLGPVTFDDAHTTVREKFERQTAGQTYRGYLSSGPPPVSWD